MAGIIGLITVNSKQVLEVDDIPSTGLGTPAPIGSLAMYDSGTIGSVYIKTSAADAGWQRIDVPEGQDWELDGNDLTDAGGGATDPNEWFGSSNDFDVVHKRNNVESWRAAVDGMLIGLSASIGGRLQVKASALAADLLKQIAPGGGGSDVIHVSRMYKVLTTDGVDTTLADVAVPTDTVVAITAKVAGRQTGGSAGSAGDGAVYVREMHARNIGGTVSIRQTQTSFTSEDASTFNITPSVSTTNVRLQVRGATNRNMSWFGYVELLIAGS